MLDIHAPVADIFLRKENVFVVKEILGAEHRCFRICEYLNFFLAGPPPPPRWANPTETLENILTICSLSSSVCSGSVKILFFYGGSCKDSQWMSTSIWSGFREPAFKLVTVVNLQLFWIQKSCKFTTSVSEQSVWIKGLKIKCTYFVAE